MNPALTAILDAIEAGTVRIRWAHDDEHALTEAQAMAADVRSLLVLLADQAHTEADPMPCYRRVCARNYRSVSGQPKCSIGGGSMRVAVEAWATTGANLALDGVNDCPCVSPEELRGMVTERDIVPDPYEVAERMAVPRRNCLTCQHDWRDDDGEPRCVLVDYGTGDPEQDAALEKWVADDDNVTDDGLPKPDADNCPGYTLRESASRNTADG